MLIVDMPMPKVCITKDGYYGNCPMDRVWCAQRNAPSGTIMRDVYAEMTDNIPSWCPIKGELVRCGECKHWEEKPLIKNEKGMTRFGVCRLWHDGYLKADFYCAGGERKEKTDGES